MASACKPSCRDIKRSVCTLQLIRHWFFPNRLEYFLSSALFAQPCCALVKKKALCVDEKQMYRFFLLLFFSLNSLIGHVLLTTVQCAQTLLIKYKSEFKYFLTHPYECRVKGKSFFIVYRVCSTSAVQILISDAYLCKILCHLHGKVINPISCYMLFAEVGSRCNIHRDSKSLPVKAV